MATKYLGTFTKNTILKLPNPQIGDTVIASDTKEVYTYTETGWEIGKVENTGLNINLYDLNQSIVNQLPDLTDEALQEGCKKINDFYDNTNNTFYMLYGREMSYFTLFTPTSMAPNEDDFESLGASVLECITSFKSVKAIDLTDTGDAIEIWVSPDNDTVSCLYLFPYDSGVVGYEV